MIRQWFICFFFLTGCDKLMPIPMWNTNTSANTYDVAASNHPKTILIAGQSNAHKLIGDGYQGIQEGYGEQLNFINCAADNTSIQQWQPGDALEINCIAMAQGQKIDAIWFMQGETDAPDGGDYATWGSKFENLVNVLRPQLGNPPLLFGQLASTNMPGYLAHWDEVKMQQAMVHLLNVKMIQTDDINPNPTTNDGLHFPPGGYRHLGRRIGGELSKILKGINE